MSNATYPYNKDKSSDFDNRREDVSNDNIIAYEEKTKEHSGDGEDLNHPFPSEDSTTGKTKALSGKLEHVRDVNSHDIFKNNVLASQFLRDYSGIDLFAGVRPEDIEDQTPRYKQMLGVELEGDTVKKIHIRIDDRDEDVYVVSLIEHKSHVDYDVAMQLLFYMTVIWKDYADGCNANKAYVSRTKGFRYPLIVPIVYYEGRDNWRADMHFSDRIAHAEYIKDYIPDFVYKLIPLRVYNNEELMEHNNEMSLIMMINKIQEEEGFHDFRLSAEEFMRTVYDNTTADIRELILAVVWSLLMKIKVPEDEATDMLSRVKGDGNMGKLFADFKVFDYKKANEDLRKAEARADEAEAKADKEKDRADQAEAKLYKLEKELEQLRASITIADHIE